MKKIKLTKGKFAIVDDDMFNELNEFKWYACKGKYGRTFYAHRHERGNRKNRKVIAMQNQIMKPIKPKRVDHKNRNGLDNRRENLRLCTHQQNCANKLPTKNKHGYKGIQKIRKGFSATYAKNSKTTYIGFYKTAKEAAKAYDKMALKIYGEFATLNFNHSKAPKKK